MPIAQRPPVPVRIAGLLTTAQGLAGLGFAILLVIRAITSSEEPGKVLGEAGYFTILGTGVLAAGIFLLLGKHWARSPAVVVQLLLAGVAWYAYGPSGQRLFGALLGAYCVLVLVLLFSNSARGWALGLDDEAETSDR